MKKFLLSLVFFCLIIGLSCGFERATVYSQSEPPQEEESTDVPPEPPAETPAGALRNSALGQLNAGAGAEVGEVPSDPRLVVANIIKFFLSFLGIIFTVLMVYAGYLYLISRGEEDKLTKAKSTIRMAIIGLVIIFIGYAIVGYVITVLQTAVGTAS